MESTPDVATNKPVIKDLSAFPIPEVFSGKSVFLTGVTGFLGKVLLEKLLRSCSDIKHVYVLLRPKKYPDVKARLDALLKNKAFDRVRAECENNLLKVVPVNGDISSEDLGLTEDHLKILRDDVSFVFHCAANVRFDETIRKSLTVNLVGTKNVLLLCDSISSIQAFVHVSTAYSFCNYSHIKEETYPDVVDPENMIVLLEWMNAFAFEEVCKNVCRRPSNYHFTKAMAEILLAKGEARRYGIGIIRPSIITAAWKEPFPGWVDTFYGPSGLILACGKGIVRSVHAKRDVTADFVPVDVVVNSAIVLARHVSFHKQSNVFIVNCTAPMANRITWMDVERICFPLILKYPSVDVFRYPGGHFTESSLFHKLCLLFDHLLPAFVVDVATWPVQSDKRVFKLYSQIHGLLRHFEFFTTNNIFFYSGNYATLVEELSEADKEIFPMNTSGLNWENYFDDYVHGLRKYVLNEPDETLPECRQKLLRVQYMWMAIRALLLVMGVAFYFLFSSRSFTNIIQYCTNCVFNWLGF